MRLTEDEIKAIEQRTKAATPGEWITEFDPYGGYDCMGPGVHITNIKGDMVVTCEDGPMKENADFIASAKQDIPRLVADLRAAKRVIEAAKRLDDVESLMGSLFRASAFYKMFKEALSAYEDGNGKV